MIPSLEVFFFLWARENETKMKLPCTYPLALAAILIFGHVVPNCLIPAPTYYAALSGFEQYISSTGIG